MKTIFSTVLLMWLFASTNPVKAQEFPEEYLGLPGDNLNLYAVMKLFQESETLEAFERSLNDENSRINNLDLNGDNFVDYIMVFDYVDGDVHNIVLRVALTRDEYQDVAVFTVERFRDGRVHVQLIGDEALYGPNYIIEPYYDLADEETPNPAYIGNKSYRNRNQANRTISVEVYSWPVIRYIYHPGYVVWRSSWHWGYEPYWWNPWRPYYWHYYYGYHYHWRPYYHRYFRVCNHYSYARYNTFYVTHVRVYSPRVTYKINNGYYKTTYSRPETRRDGEAQFARSHPERYARSQSNAIERDSRRSTGVSAARETSVSRRENTDRRNVTTINERAASNSRNGQRVDEGRRNNSTSIERSGNIQGRQESNRQPTQQGNRIESSGAIQRSNSEQSRVSSGTNRRLTETPRQDQPSGNITREPGQSYTRSAGNPSSVDRNRTDAKPEVYRSATSPSQSGVRTESNFRQNQGTVQGSSHQARQQVNTSSRTNQIPVVNRSELNSHGNQAKSNRQVQSNVQMQRGATQNREPNVVTKSASKSQPEVRTQNNRTAPSSSPSVRSSGGSNNRSAPSSPSVRSSGNQSNRSTPSSGRTESSSSARSNTSRESSSSGGSRR